MPIDDWPPLEPDPVIEVDKRDVEITLLIENLKLTPTQRQEKLTRAVRGVMELRRAGERPRRERS